MKEEGKQKSGGSITGRDVATLVINCQAPSMAVRVRENVRERLLLLFPFCGIAENFTSLQTALVHQNWKFVKNTSTLLNMPQCE
jgi:hypothetical protein